MKWLRQRRLNGQEEKEESNQNGDGGAVHGQTASLCRVRERSRQIMEQDKDCVGKKKAAEKYPLTSTSTDLIVLPCLSFALPLLSFAPTFHFPVFLPFEDFIFYLEAVQRWKEERMKGWEKQNEASRGRQKWIGKIKVEMGRWRGKENGGVGENWGR